MGEALTYAPRKAIKSQALADFIVEWTDTQLPLAQVQAEIWTMYFDGSLMKTGAGAGLIFISPLGVHVRYVIRIHFATSNNIIEYEAQRIKDRYRARGPTPRRPRRFSAGHRPSHESLELSRPKNGGLLQRSMQARRQVPRPRAHPHGLTVQ